MDIMDLNESAFVDLFPATPGQQGPVGAVTFGMQEGNADILQPPPEEIVPPILPAEGDEKEPVEVVAEGEVVEADIIGEPAKPGRKPKYDFSDMSGYYEDRLKAGKFVKIETENDKGEKVAFIPKTPEDFDEVIDLQVNYKLDQERKGLDQKWYQSKSPAWQVVGKYAELVDNPAELIPFLQGVRNLQTVGSIDENEIEGAEQIVRIRMEQAGNPESVISSQVESLKSTDKLVATAKELKPLMIQQEQQTLSQQLQQREEADKKYALVISEMRDAAIKTIDQPIFGKQKLKQDEKMAIYELIGEPSEDQKGYAIYSEIDKLFDKKDFETLRQVALLLSKKDSFYSYLGTSVADSTAAGLQRKLVIAGDSRNASGNDITPDDSPVIKRNQFSKTVKFGR